MAAEQGGERLQTQVIHAGSSRPRLGGAAVHPIFQCTVFENPEGASYEELRYPRLSTLPDQQLLQRRLAALEGGEAGLVTASGMAAITAALLQVLRGGGHLLIQEGLYGGTHSFVTEDLESFGIRYDFIDAGRPDTWAARLRPDTRAIYTEALTNPLLRIADHAAIVAFAREHSLVTLIDNTFATPVNFRPLEVGYDLVLHSATKYLNGHSDLAAGAVVGSVQLVHPIHHFLNHHGGSLDPHGCFLLTRGLKTLVLRVERHNENARELAAFLAEHPGVRHVHHPALPGHPDRERGRAWFRGFGGMLSFEPEGGVAGARRFLARARIPCHGPSLGGVETLMTRPVTTSHRGVPREERERLGITESLVRVSVGIEAIEDLIADFDQALRPD